MLSQRHLHPSQAQIHLSTVRTFRVGRVQMEKPGAFSMKAHPPDITRHRRNPIRNWLETLGGARRGECAIGNTRSDFLASMRRGACAANGGVEKGPGHSASQLSVRRSPASLRGCNLRHRRLVGNGRQTRPCLLGVKLGCLALCGARLLSLRKRTYESRPAMSEKCQSPLRSLRRPSIYSGFSQ